MAVIIPLSEARGSFIDRMRPVTDAETKAWKAYLALPRQHWRAARDMFRRASQGDDPGGNFIRFVAQTGIDDQGMLDALEAALCELALEGEVGR